MRPIEEPVTVYNVDAGLVSATIDSATRVLNLKGCTLCTLPHGSARARAQWQECKTTFGVLKGPWHHNAALTGMSLPAARG